MAIDLKKYTQNRPAMIAAAGAAFAILVAFVPVRMRAAYTALAYSGAAIEDAAIEAELCSALGVKYKVNNLAKSANICGMEETELTVSAGFYHTKLTLTPVPFEHYEIAAQKPIYYEQKVSPADVAVSARYADGAVLPTEAAVTLSGTTADANTTATVKGLYGTETLPLPISPIEHIILSENGSDFAALYSDGHEEKIAVKASAKYEAPQVLSCEVQDGELRMELETDPGKPRYYSVFYADGSRPAGTESLGGVYGSGKLTISLPWQTQFLQEGFVVAGTSRDADMTVSGRKFITNAGDLAERRFALPKQPSKKGLQVNINLLDELPELGTHHTLINITLDQMAVGNFPYEYNGETYHFNESYIAWLDAETAALGKLGVNTTAVLLLQYEDAASYLVLPGARTRGHTYYGLNVVEPAPRNMLAAMFTFLAERYSDEEHRVFNWILGNEVANYRDWYYSGSIGFEEYMDNYIRAFRMLDNCTKSVYPYGKCYISLDNCWRFPRGFAYLGKNVLDHFAKSMEEQGEIDWGLAYHAHSEPLSDASFWSAGPRVSDSIYSQMISMKNLDYLTDYIRDTYGPEHTLILSETGFTSSQGEDIQAAALAYAYYLCEENDMIDALLYHRHSDEPSEMRTDFYFGLWSNNTGTPDGYTSKKKAWTVYKYMDTDPSYTDFAPAVIGVSSWSQLLKNPPKKAAK